jgi:hypothetical protein
MTTLLSLLEVDRGQFPDETLAAVRFIERTWMTADKPVAVDPLADLLDSCLRSCKASGCTYPKIMLKRLKQMRRGEWKPNLNASTVPVVQPGGICIHCGGNKICPCGRRHAALDPTCCSCHGTGLEPSWPAA